MAEYIAKAAVVKVAVGPASGNRVARFIRAGSPIPEGVDQDLLDALAKRDLITKVRQPSAAAKAKADAEAAEKAKADADAAAKAAADKEAAEKAAAK